MLDHADGLDVAQRLALERLVNRLGVDRFVALLQPNLEDPVMGGRNLHERVRIGNCRRNGLLDENMFAGLRRRSNRVNVPVIWCANYQAIHIRVRKGFFF